MTRFRHAARLIPACGLALALTVPAAGFGAPSPAPAARAADRGEQKQGKRQHAKKADKAKQQRRHADRQRRDGGRREARVERQARPRVRDLRQERRQIQRALQRQRLQERRAQTIQRHVARQRALRQQALDQQAFRRRQALRQDALRRNRIDTVRERHEAARRTRFRGAPGRSIWVDRGIANRPGRGIFHVNGEVTAEGLRCTAMRGDDGRLYTLEGDLFGLRPGDDIQVAARVVRDSACRQGTTLAVHRLSFLDRADRRWDGRRDRGSILDRIFGRDDDGWDEDRWSGRAADRGALVELHGHLAGAGGCPALRADDGRTYELAGDLRGFGRGDRVRVIGVAEGGSRCGVGPSLRVAEIDRA